MRSRSAPGHHGSRSIVRIAATLTMSALTVTVLPSLAIALLFVWSGSSSVTYRALSPDGALEARIERQGGSMQFPVSSLVIRSAGGLLSATRDDCVVTGWSGRDRNDQGPSDPRGDPLVALRWHGARTLVASDPNHVLALPLRACGITVVPSSGDLT